jgi:NitT/TauT family transport system substrate-binding protein
VRSTTRRSIAWALALVVALAAVGVAFARSGEVERESVEAPASPSPQVPDDPGEGCGRAATTDPTDLGVGRTLARCGAAAPAARPLPAPTTVRVALAERTESAAPLLVADALGELEAENLVAEITEMDQREAYAAMAAGDVDVVVGGVDGPFFDAVHEGLDARLVLGGPVARAPSDFDTAQAGLWLRAELISDDDKWDNVEGQLVVVPGGLGSAALYPIDTTLQQHELTVNSLYFEAGPPAESVDRLRAADIGGAWLTEPAATQLAGDSSLRLVATAPGGEAIEGTVFAPALLGADRATGLAYVRAIMRTINTHLADGYSDDARTALADALGVPEDEIAAGPAPLFDWEVRAGTTTRIQEALVLAGGVGYERPTAERELVDRTLVDDVITDAS